MKKIFQKKAKDGHSLVLSRSLSVSFTQNRDEKEEEEQEDGEEVPIARRKKE